MTKVTFPGVDPPEEPPEEEEKDDRRASEIQVESVGLIMQAYFESFHDSNRASVVKIKKLKNSLKSLIQGNSKRKGVSKGAQIYMA